jgi:hypothetical protein
LQARVAVGSPTHRPHSTSPPCPSDQKAEGAPRYALSIKRFRIFLERLPGGHRPPTGPLTTSEATAAEELQQEKLAKDNERVEREQKEAGRDQSG